MEGVVNFLGGRVPHKKKVFPMNTKFDLQKTIVPVKVLGQLEGWLSENCEKFNF